MPAIPIPQQAPIERAGWNADFNAGGLLTPANNDRTPANPIDVANTQAQQQSQQQLQGAQAANAISDVQQRQRSMQLSMLSGVLSEPDPDKQKQLLQNLVPIANKINPSYQIDSNIDVPTVRALVQSQVSPTEQATLANNLQRAQMVNSLKAQDVVTDPATGAKVIIDKYTGVQRPITPQENEYYSATGQLPGSGGIGQPAPTATGIFPNTGSAGQNAFQNFKTQSTGGAVPVPPGGGAPLTGSELGAQPPAFGFPPSNYTSNPNALKLAQKNAATFDAQRGQRDILANQAEQKIAELEPDLTAVQGGGLAGKSLGIGNFFGTEQGKTAGSADAETKDLALTLSQMQQTTGNKAMKASLQTLLASKPDPYNQYPETNEKLLANIKAGVGQYKLETEFLDAYKDANPQHILDDNAYKLFDSLSKTFPLVSVSKDGKANFNADNIDAFRQAIPDALSNPSKYMNAKTQAADRLQQPQQQTGQAATQANAKLQQPNPQQQTPIDTPEAVGEAYKSGKITLDQAKTLLAKHGFQ